MRIVNDIKEFGREVLERALEMCPNAKGIIVGGCPPCQSLGVAQGQPEESGESVHKFFPDVVKVFMVVDEVARERGIWTLKLMENVVTALDDLEQMSVGPVMVDSGDISRASRPRMYWVSRPIPEQKYFDWKIDVFGKLIIKGVETEPLISLLRPECEWPGGEADENLRFQSFTRPIKREEPPDDDTGLRSALPGAQARWTRDEFRYPLRAYAQEFMVETQVSEVRPAEEREVLMGYSRHHALALLKKAPTTLNENQVAEDARCAALGNASHVTILAVLLDEVLGAMRLKGIKGPVQIAQNHIEEAMKRFVQEAEEEAEEAGSRGGS